MHPSLYAAAATIALLGAMPAAAVTKYRLTELTGATAPRTINNAGMIAGEAGGGGGAGRLDNGSALFTPPAGYDQVYARGISGIGRTALTFQGAGVNDKAAIGFPDGTLVTLNPLAGAAAAGVFGIYNGKFAGYSLTSGTLPGFAGTPSLQAAPVGSLRATVWDDFTTPRALANPFGSGNSIATAINFNGVVGGTVLNAANQQRAVVWAADGTATALGLQAGQTNALVRDINEAGDALGRTTGALGGLATIWSHGNIYSLTGLGNYTSTTGRGLNDRGMAVGFGTDASGNTQGLYWSFNGSGYDSYALDSLIVNLAGWQTNAVQSINDDGTIVGIGRRADGSEAGYVLTAVPEPASWAMMIAGFGLIGASARRRRGRAPA